VGPGSQRRPDGSEGSSPSRRGASAATLYSVDPEGIGGHDAVMRIGAELRAAGPFHQSGTRAMGGYGTPPPRIVIGDPAPTSGTHAELRFSCLFPAQIAVCMRTPAGTKPVVTSSHSAIKSLRAPQSWSSGWCGGRSACAGGTIWRARCPAGGAETAKRAGSAPVALQPTDLIRGAPGHCRPWPALSHAACCRSDRAHHWRRPPGPACGRPEDRLSVLPPGDPADCASRPRVPSVRRWPGPGRRPWPAARSSGAARPRDYL
jgi:hypothetical protein